MSVRRRIQKTENQEAVEQPEPEATEQPKPEVTEQPAESEWLRPPDFLSWTYSTAEVEAFRQKYKAFYTEYLKLTGKDNEYWLDGLPSLRTKEK